MPRLFVAIDLPGDIRERLSSICFGVPGARWVVPEHMHLTLRFIGDVDSTVFIDVCEALDGVRYNGFSMQLEGVGFFPPRGKPRVIWVGVRNNEHLFKLRNRVESALVQAGLKPEGRKYSPHITLARLKDTHGAKVADFLARNSMLLTHGFSVRDFYLYSSVLSSKGAKHYIEQGYQLDPC